MKRWEIFADNKGEKNGTSKKMVPGTPKSLPDNWNYRNAFVTLFMATVFSSDVQSLTLGLPIAAGIYCYKYLNEKKENPNENDEQKHSHPETKKPAPGKVRGHAEAPGGVQKSPDETRSEPVKQRRKQGRKQGRKRGVSGGDGPK